MSTTFFLATFSSSYRLGLFCSSAYPFLDTLKHHCPFLFEIIPGHLVNSGENVFGYTTPKEAGTNRIIWTVLVDCAELWSYLRGARYQDYSKWLEMCSRCWCLFKLHLPFKVNS